MGGWTKTGVATGPVPDLVQELARTLNVKSTIIPAPDAAGVIAALKNGTRRHRVPRL